MTIIVGYNDLAPSHRALDVALDLAAATSSRVVLVNGTAPESGVGDEIGAVASAITDLAEEALKAGIARAAQRGANVDTLAVPLGPLEALVHAARALDARLIVVGTRTPSRLELAVKGHLGLAVAAATTTPVVLAHT